MDKKRVDEKESIIDLDDFEEQVSLWQLIPAGKGEALQRLKLIVDAELNSKTQKENRRPLSLLISGKNGDKVLHAKAFLRALGIEQIKKTSAQLAQNYNDLIEFFHLSTLDTGHIISGAQNMKGLIVKDLYNIVSQGVLTRWNYANMGKTGWPVLGPVIVTSYAQKAVPLEVREHFTHRVEIEDYSKAQLEQVCIQRLAYANIAYEKRVPGLLTDLRNGYDSVIQLLRDSVLVMRAEGRKTLTEKDVIAASAFD
ncbi:hypothetical protein STSP2_03257 [Anaerohalosphaera lusitana]|uniref:Uncharacterized protein n=1 Tax=Anaerohalosphaera lusitana TaxID=1936003 RepID=A0A1U9NQF8_9BACT|nr:hypothetical protein [Anaerohalosphaera lusitana]AQT70055.1 hypothetical protein STSP2_03257 [Anaerohalosphaera lusitana]